MAAVTHLAGNRVIVGNYAVQRCLLCGEILDEFNASRVASPDGGALSELVVGGFYEFEANRFVLVRETDSPHFESDLELPDNCCIRKER